MDALNFFSKLTNKNQSLFFVKNPSRNPSLKVQNIRYDIIQEQLAASGLRMPPINVENNLEKTYQLMIEYINENEVFTDDERIVAERQITEIKDIANILYVQGVKYLCTVCQRSSFSMSYCEHCTRDCLERDISWSSGFKDIDDLIEGIQSLTPLPNRVFEYIPYEDLENVVFKGKGGFASVYNADWKKGNMDWFDCQKQQFERSGNCKVILKRLQSTPNELPWNATFGTALKAVVPIVGLSIEPATKEVFLVMTEMESDLRTHIQENHSHMRWSEAYRILWQIIDSLSTIHTWGLAHRNLHSCNVLNRDGHWLLSDLGTLDWENTPIDHFYGRMPYLAPEVLCGRQNTQASDIYSFGMLMYEVVTGNPPFSERKQDLSLFNDVLNGLRPIIPKNVKLPELFKSLLRQCWDAYPENRPMAHEILDYFQNGWLNMKDTSIDPELDSFTHSFLSWNFEPSQKKKILRKSKFYKLHNTLPEPRNASQAYESENSSSLIPVINESKLKKFKVLLGNLGFEIHRIKSGFDVSDEELVFENQKLQPIPRLRTHAVNFLKLPEESYTEVPLTPIERASKFST
ncbi:hypothetical protein G9A89_002311 [Geosiphon pyriformis]|nr:hypothetical protein G9A89_002311 [Geosiphon pyriformis]